MNSQNGLKIEVLFIEDKPEDIEFINLLLTYVKDVSFSIESASNLQDGLKLIKSPDRKFDVILLDLNLPESKGLDTLSILMSHMPTAPIVVLTAIEDEKTALQAVRMGAQDYLMKGQINGRALARMMRYAIERRRATELLNVSEERFRQLIQTAYVSVVCISQTHRIMEFNQEAERIFGAKRDDVMGKDFLKLFIPSEKQEKLKSDLQEVIQGKMSTHYETTIRTPDGSERILMSNMSRLTNADGSPIGVMICGHDITERARLEEALKMKEKIYRTLARHIPQAAVFLLDLDYRIMIVEGTIFDKWNFRYEFMEGRKIHDFLAAEELALLKPHYEKALRSESAHFTGRFRDQNFEVKLMPLTNGGREVLAVIATAFQQTKQL